MCFMIDSVLFNVQRQIINAYLGRKYVTQCINIIILCIRFISLLDVCDVSLKKYTEMRLKGTTGATTS